MSFQVNSKGVPRTLAALCGSAVLALACVGARATVYNPPILLSNGIEYMSGGIGSDEAELMRTVEARWPAVFEFAVKDGRKADFAADVTLTVRDAQGRMVLDHVRSGGPYLVVRLHPGKYSAEAVLAGRPSSARSPWVVPALRPKACSSGRKAPACKAPVLPERIKQIRISRQMTPCGACCRVRRMQCLLRCSILS